MKINTQDLTGPALDYAVAKCEGVPVDAPGYDWKIGHWAHQYSIDWAAAGVIIGREGEVGGWSIYYDPECVWYSVPPSPVWVCVANRNRIREAGPTPLIAAMRCYVASKLGAEVEIPEELAP